MDTAGAASAHAIQVVWWGSLALGLVVSAVVATLLWLIQSTAKTIDTRVSSLWDTGQRVANNTVHVPALVKTSEVAGQILAVAVRIDAGAAAIEAHARGCPGCPQCMLGK
ncbi:MAG: hypothetical protein ABIN08_17410 [Caldimonas sp.]